MWSWILSLLGGGEKAGAESQKLAATPQAGMDWMGLMGKAADQGAQSGSAPGGVSKQASMQQSPMFDPRFGLWF